MIDEPVSACQLNGNYSVLHGDCRESLRAMAARGERVQMCVTSPPYFGLRDYGVDGQLGLEQTPEQYVEAMVEVFRCVRDVLDDDGTLWLNIGDSYARNPAKGKTGTPNGRNVAAQGYSGGAGIPVGLKEKDLIGIPWALAKALRDPYYTGRIKSERDRVWLAAIIDGEGSISGYEHTRKDDGSERTGLNICVTNTNGALLAECSRIWPASTHNHVPAGTGHLGIRRVDRWIPQGASEKAQLLEELYPYLIAKRTQALVGWNLAQAMMNGKRDGHSARAQDARARRVLLVHCLRKLNAGEHVDLPEWLQPVPDPFRPGWHLRQEIIWHKPNPMPESVTDRCTKAHESLFLLTKRPSYYFDHDAIREPWEGEAAKAVAIGTKKVGQRGINASARRGLAEGQATQFQKQGHSGYFGADGKCLLNPIGKNKRSVWTVATRAYKGAHFATFPPALIEPCILAGSRPGDIVLDPFGGSGTTAGVAVAMNRRAVLCELNPEYAELVHDRVASILEHYGKAQKPKKSLQKNVAQIELSLTETKEKT